jgi:hypothetical protein
MKWIRKGEGMAIMPLEVSMCTNVIGDTRKPAASGGITATVVELRGGRSM